MFVQQKGVYPKFHLAIFQKESDHHIQGAKMQKIEILLQKVKNEWTNICNLVDIVPLAYGVNSSIGGRLMEREFI